MKKLLPLTLLAFLSACSTGDHTDLKQWMKKETSSMKGRIEPLPSVQTFKPVAFTGTNNPFEFKDIISIKDIDKTKYQPDFNRRKTQLETYQLTKLSLSGFIKKDNRDYAVIRTPVGIVSYVSIGDYIGTNYGQIVGIDDSKITISETIQDAAKGWIKKEAILELE